MGNLGQIGKGQRPFSIRQKEEERLALEIQAAHKRTRQTYGPENLLEQKFNAAAPNQVWLTDITYIPTEEGWLYLAGHKDLFTGAIVGYAMAERMTKNLVSQSLIRALTTKRPAAGLIHHSDRGSQYCAQGYFALLNRFRMRASNRPGKEIAMITPPWKAFGVYSRTN